MSGTEITERELKELAFRLGGEMPSSVDGPTLRRAAEALLIHYGYVSPQRHERTVEVARRDERESVVNYLIAVDDNARRIAREPPVPP